MALNIGYLKAKTDKASDEVYTPAYAVKPILNILNKIVQYGVLLIQKKANM